ncbi:10705_t:CDS:2 [Scutellospora calospora]|uniref:10705_t:CDS:1 n=1 Tax=Scutellospora calospora TaxID=85575 RepID=A0ACA9L437_9GLOM|nr:10705_t:CDS:2 [Scutellospora calospora]
MSSSKRKEKTTLSNQQRKKIIEFKEKHPSISNVDLVDWVKKNMGLEVHPSTIRRLIKNKDNIGDNLSAKRQKTVQYPDLENSLLEWILQNQDHIILSDAILIEKAKSFAKLLKIPNNSLKFSHGWLYKFKKRHGISQIIQHGEDASVDDNVVATAIPKLRELLAKFELKDVYNMDEMGFLKGRKKNKDRLTVAFCVNVDRTDKLKPFVIRKYHNLRCFKGIKCNRLGVTYDNSANAWMTTVLFQNWLKEFDLKMAGRKTLLLIDGAKCYSYKNLNLRNITVHVLPPNTTSRIQPLNAGIIMSFKRRYKSYFIKWLLDQYESGNDKKLNVLNAIKFIVKAWKEVSSETLMKELREDIEALHLRNVMNLEEYIDYPEEKKIHEALSDYEIVNLAINPEPEENISDEDDDSTEMCQVTHNKVLNATYLLEQYLLQQDLYDTTWSNYDKALSNLQKTIRKL